MGMATCGLSEITIVTPVAPLKAPGLLSTTDGWLDPRLPRTIAGKTPVEDAPIWLAASIVAVRYVAAARFEICAWSEVGFETAVTVTERLAAAAICVVKPRVNTFELKVAVVQPAGVLEHPRPGFPGKPERVMTRRPPLGMATCGLSEITIVTPVAPMKAPGLLSTMDGWLDPRGPNVISGRVPVKLLARTDPDASVIAAFILFIEPCTVVGFDIPVTLMVMVPGARPEVGALPKVREMIPLVSEATLQPTGELEHWHELQLKPVRVIINFPFFGNLLSVVIKIVIATPTAHLYGKLRVMDG